MIVLADIDAAGNWQPGLGDNTVAGWMITLAYLIATGLCYLAWRRESRRRFEGHEELRPRFWLAMMLVMLALGLNKQLDLQTLVSVVGRRAAKSMGWYDVRREVQAAFVIGVAVIAATALGVLAVWIRSSFARYWIAAAGAAYLAVFIVLRAASFHHVDSVLYRIPGVGMWANRSLELFGIALVAISAAVVSRCAPRNRRDAQR